MAAVTQVVVGRGKLTVKDLGNPSMVKAQADDNFAPYVLGVIFGRCTNVKEKAIVQPSGEVTVVPQLIGLFEGRRAVPLDNKDGTETVAIRASVLYLPSGIAEMVSEALMGAEQGMCDFAFQVSSIKASNPAGYTYQVINLHSPAGSDPLDDLRELAKTQLLSIAAPKHGLVKSNKEAA